MDSRKHQKKLLVTFPSFILGQAPSQPSSILLLQKLLELVMDTPCARVSSFVIEGQMFCIARQPFFDVKAEVLHFRGKSY